jgi:hypothetical protein
MVLVIVILIFLVIIFKKGILEMKSRQVSVTEYFCAECDMWIRREQTWVCERCAERFCTENEPKLITEDGIYFCEKCCKELSKPVVI